MASPPVPASVLALFEAMNAHDADAAVAATEPDVEIHFGPHVMSGHAAVRELAEQQDPELVIESHPISCREEDGGFAVSVHRVGRWRSTGETASEDTSTYLFVLGDAGLVRLSRLVRSL